MIQELDNLLNRISPTKDDLLIFLGDYVDRGHYSYSVIDKIVKLKDFCRVITLRGNHDYEFFETYKQHCDIMDKWTVDNIPYDVTKYYPFWNQGGKETVLSYLKQDKLISEHLSFYQSCADYFVKDNKCFVHGGFNRHLPISTQSSEVLLWDRDLLLAAMSHQAGSINKYKFKINDKFDEVYVGHTPVNHWGHKEPKKFGPVWAIDTGVGKYGAAVLYGVNVDSGEII